MRGVKRHMAVLALGFVLVTLVVACGGTPQPTPTPTLDVEATVEATEDCGDRGEAKEIEREPKRLRKTV